ncbi:hypothetical protein QRX60_35470 [Amycolatopsis mongoliensis]|uniref:Uncharacterized protein n=1 Tax=Amycolatopsis mongoliensis TaxID=715475 RepID=A0A9Y2JL82_9PSEU|nr:hypothetical protein [Amycolatopsis sp. 4-36]WIX99321.1 hypothetical protein QRX60_35470 [Amycolatopsis sp. 4-36]
MSIKRQPGESRAQFIQRLVAAAPPLTEQQRARLRPVLASMREPQTDRGGGPAAALGSPC